MAKNRKNMSAAVRFGPSIKALLLCLFIGGAGIGYVWQKTQISELGRQIKKLEDSYSWHLHQNQMKINRLDTMRTPKAIEEQAVKMKLGMVEPLPQQKFRIIETSSAGRVAPVDRQFIAQAPP